MTDEQQFEALRVRVASAYRGEDMVIRAACRAHRIGRESIWDADEAIALLLDCGWTWDDVLQANS